MLIWCFAVFVEMNVLCFGVIYADLQTVSVGISFSVLVFPSFFHCLTVTISDFVLCLLCNGIRFLVLLFCVQSMLSVLVFLHFISFHD